MKRLIETLLLALALAIACGACAETQGFRRRLGAAIQQTGAGMAQGVEDNKAHAPRREICTQENVGGGYVSQSCRDQ